MACENFNDNETEAIKTGRVTFVNESSYRLKIRRDSFSGPVVAEFFPGEFSQTVDMRVSDTNGYGSTFSVEYLYRINTAHDFEPDSGDILASGFDHNVQINRVIEEGKSYTIQIPQPKNLEFRTAFIKLLNTHSLPFQLQDHGRVLRQAGNNIIPVAPGKTGIYSLTPAGGEQVYSGYRVTVNMDSTIIPDFTVKNGVVYSFTFNGSSVAMTGEQTIIFN